ncbi:MAG: DUF262 domain-containing protein [Polynucleobacter sp.]|nr:DUF262 domain-containing protein [Polynucleobacter sp.]
MGLYESVGQKPLKDLLNEIHVGAARLPDFQREFVWDPSGTISLILSIAQGFPAGSILRVNDTQNAFATRQFAGAPDHKIRHSILVLDGQQRLTSLYQAFYGTGDYRYFVDIQKLLDSDDLSDDGIIFFKKVSKKVKGGKSVDDAFVKNLTYHAERGKDDRRYGCMPLSVIFQPSKGFTEWVLEVRDKLGKSEQKKFEDTMLRKVRRRAIGNIENYDFPTITLDGSTSVEALCTIFETLNKTGVRLTVSEILTARFAKDKINLKKLWTKAVDDYPILVQYGVELYPILQAITLISGPTATCKKKDVLKLTGKSINDHWDSVVKNMVLGLTIMREDCHIMTEKWLPTPGMLGPLAAILTIGNGAKGKRRGSRIKTPQAGVVREKVVRWLWCSIFGQRYEAAANTRGEKDVNDMRQWLDDESKLPEAIKQFRFDPLILREVTTRSGSVYKGAICLTLCTNGGALDFHTGAKINEQMIASNEVDDHHIFPKNYLQKTKKEKDQKLINCVLNRTLIDRKTNQSIKDKAPSKYIKELKSLKKNKILESHLIPIGPNSPLSKNDFKNFLNQRSAMLEKKIKDVTSGK